MNLRSTYSVPKKPEQKDCFFKSPPEHCCVLCINRKKCNVFTDYICTDCKIHRSTYTNEQLTVLFSCYVGPISSKEFQEYIQKKQQNINLRRSNEI